MCPRTILPRARVTTDRTKIMTPFSSSRSDVLARLQRGRYGEKTQIERCASKKDTIRNQTRPKASAEKTECIPIVSASVRTQVLTTRHILRDLYQGNLHTRSIGLARYQTT